MNGDLVIEREDVLLEIPRGAELLRVTRVEATTGTGKPIAWHSIRIFWKGDDGTWKPGKSGITIRSRELEAIAVALSKEVGGALAPSSTARALLPDEEYRRRRGEVSR